MKHWMASDLSGLDLLVIQIDGIHMDEDLILVAAIGVDAKGDKHPLGLTEGATENAATVQSLIDNLVERGLTGGAAALHDRRRQGVALAVDTVFDGKRKRSPAT
jgi:transposase-like protein